MTGNMRPKLQQSFFLAALSYYKKRAAGCVTAMAHLIRRAMVLKLYYMPGACSLATHIVLEWAGLPYQSQKVPRDELKSPAYLKINQLGAVYLHWLTATGS